MSAAASEPVWHYTSQNQRKGPVTLENLQTLVSRGRLNLEKDMVWNPEMSEWAVAGSIKELADIKFDPAAGPAAKAQVAPSLSAPASPAPAAPAEAPAPKKPEKVRETTSPYQTPRAQGAETGELKAAMDARRGDDGYPGMGRLGYFFFPWLSLIVVIPAFYWLMYMGGEKSLDNETMAAAAIGVLLVLCILFFVYPVFSRLRNLSMSGWNVLWSFVPIMCYWLGYRLFACPPGYGEHKKMDGIGKFLAVLYFLPLILSILLLILGVVFGGAAKYKEEADRAMREMEAEKKKTEQVIPALPGE